MVVPGNRNHEKALGQTDQPRRPPVAGPARVDGGAPRTKKAGTRPMADKEKGTSVSSQFQASDGVKPRKITAGTD